MTNKSVELEIKVNDYINILEGTYSERIAKLSEKYGQVKNDYYTEKGRKEMNKLVYENWRNIEGTSLA